MRNKQDQVIEAGYILITIACVVILVTIVCVVLAALGFGTLFLTI